LATVLIELDDSQVLYLQIYRHLRAAILGGQLQPGAKLPSTRALASELGVSRRTVLVAYDQLIAEGYVVGEVGSGTRVAPLPALEAPPEPPAAKVDGRMPPQLSAYGQHVAETAPLPPPSFTLHDYTLRYDFNYGIPALEHFPRDVWRRLFATYIKRASTRDLAYGPPEGHPVLRDAIARYLQTARAVECDAAQILVVGGSQQALDLTARVLLDPGDGVVVEEPQYQSAREVFHTLGARLIPVPVDEDGLDVSRLPQRPGAARLVYVTPSHQFPTGATMPLSRRMALLEWAERVGAYVLEDDYDSEFRYGDRPVPAVQGLDRADRVAYMGTFSKVLFPAVRLGYLVLPRALVRPFAAAKWLADRHASTIEQQVIAEYMSGGHFDRHLRRARAQAARRQQALIDALAEHFGDRVEVSGANAGLHRLVWFDDIDASRLDGLIERAARTGVGVYSAAPYYVRPPSRAGLVMGYASMPEEDIRAGVALLAETF
jgi:GntR family transcriptional regulator / MocR family aminotransferase